MDIFSRLLLLPTDTNVNVETATTNDQWVAGERPISPTRRCEQARSCNGTVRLHDALGTLRPAQKRYTVRPDEDAVFHSWSVLAVNTRSLKISGIVLLLLVVVALSHKATNSDLEDLAPKKKAEEPAKPQKAEDQDHSKGKPVELPKPMGSPNALVKINVYVTSDNTCDTTTLGAMQELAKELGDRVYVKFEDLLEADKLKEAQEAKIGCKSGLTINGKSKFMLPDRGLKGAILLDGPIGQANYDMHDIKDIVYHLLDQKGLVTKEELAAHEAEAAKSLGPDGKPKR